MGDTIFHSLMRGSNPVTRILGWSDEETKRRVKDNDFTIGSLFVYMALHACSVGASALVAVACWQRWYIHGSLCALMALSSIYRGSARYSYYMLQNYTTVLRKEFVDVLEEGKVGS